ncbi:MAG: glycosyltransferase [Acidobacteriota bacterium]|nr:glycosyltransferase [Acidobacteriota bacterium]
MRIDLIIDHLDSGGAQRQLVVLAHLLKKAGHEVRVIVYYDQDFFGDELRQAGVTVKLISPGSKLSRIIKVRTAIRKHKPDAVIAYLHTPGILAELAGFPRRKFAVISSELTGTTGVMRKGDGIRYQLHRLADAVVTNGQTLADFVTRQAPWLKNKMHVIVNCVELDRFTVPDKPERPGVPNVVVLGRLSPEKNPMVLVRALILLRDRHGVQARVDWYGNPFFVDGKPGPNSGVYLELIDGIEKAGLQDQFYVHQPTTDVVPLYQNASIICLPSLYEGMSNVICEALSCGRPALVSRICDNDLLVRPGENGYLFDPENPQELADCLYDFSQLDVNRRAAMGARSRQIAEELLAPSVFLKQYESLAMKHMKS